MNKPYAEWRAECCKADIEMFGNGAIDPPTKYTDERHAKQREWAHKRYWEKKNAAKRVQTA